MRPFALLSLALLLVACDPPEDSGAGSNSSGLSDNLAGKAEQKALRGLKGEGLNENGQKQFVGLAAKPGPAEQKEKLDKEPTSAGQQQSDGQNTVSETQALRLNIAPSIASVTAANDATYAVRGGSLVYTVSASDPEGDALSYQWHYRRSGGTSAWTDFIGETTATFAPAADWELGDYEIAVTVSDSKGGTANTKAGPKAVKVKGDGSFSYTAITATVGGTTTLRKNLERMGGFNADHYTFAAKDIALIPIGVSIDPATGQISVAESEVTAAAAGSYTVTATPKPDGFAAEVVTAPFTITVVKTDISTHMLTVPAPPTFAASASDAQLAPTAISVNDDEGDPLRLDTDYTLEIAPRTEGPAFIPAQGVKASIPSVNAVLTLKITDEGKVSATPVGSLVGGEYIYTVTATGKGNYYEGTVTQDVTITVTQDVSIPEKPAFVYTKAITATARGSASPTSGLIGTGGFNADHYTFTIAKDDGAPLPNGMAIDSNTGQISVLERYAYATADSSYTVTATPKPDGPAAGGENVTASVRIAIN